MLVHIVVNSDKKKSSLAARERATTTKIIIIIIITVRVFYWERINLSKMDCTEYIRKYTNYNIQPSSDLQ